MPIYPSAIYRPVTGHDGGAVQGLWLGVAVHVQDGYGSCWAIFQDSVTPERKSAHFWISKVGLVEQYLDTDLISYAQRAGNATYISVETEGLPSEPLTDAQVRAFADLYRWGHTACGWSFQLAEHPGERGIGWHGMGGELWGHPLCPGDLRKAQRQQILDLAEGQTTKEQAMTMVIDPVGVMPRPQNDGGWAFGAHGHVYAFGKAKYWGGWDDGTRNDPARLCVALVPTASGEGYWLVSNLGETYSYQAPEVGNYQSQWGAGQIIGAFRNDRIPGGGITMVRDDAQRLDTYALPDPLPAA